MPTCAPGFMVQYVGTVTVMIFNFCVNVHLSVFMVIFSVGFLPFQSPRAQTLCFLDTTRRQI